MGLDIRVIREKPETEVLRYWKINFLYAYFEPEKVEGVWKASVTKAKATKLVEKCRKVLEDHSLAEKELPTKAGLFWGSTAYDVEYFARVEVVMESFEELLKNWDKGRYYITFTS